ARELAEKFAAARVDQQLYERRLTIRVKYASSGKLDAENSSIDGNEDGVNLLGFHHMPGMRWADVRSALDASVEWPIELEQAMGGMACGQLPPPLSPFRTPSGIFIPVIVRAEIVDRQLRQVFVIFVPADAERLAELFENSSLPKRMPANLQSLVRLLRLLFRARWDIVEPRRSEATYKNPSKERCAEILNLVFSDYDELASELGKMQLNGNDAFHDLFSPEVWEEIDACTSEWVSLTGESKANPPENAKDLSRLLTAMRSNNAKWMNLGAAQFSKDVARFCARV
ncbi:MAG: hypothetical protein ACJ8KX_12120, partial [Chthoniobacterales bacterium]